jgi:hypothetical protein
MLTAFLCLVKFNRERKKTRLEMLAKSLFVFVFKSDFKKIKKILFLLFLYLKAILKKLKNFYFFASN